MAIIVDLPIEHDDFPEFLVSLTKKGILKPPLNHILPPQDSRQASHRHLLTPSLLGRDAAQVAFQVGHLRNGT